MMSYPSYPFPSPAYSSELLKSFRSMMYPFSAPHSGISSRNSVLPTEPICLSTIDIARDE